MEAGDVGARVVTGGVEVLAFFADPGVIESRYEELFPHVGGRNDPMAVRACNAGTAIGKRLACRRGNHVTPSRASTDILRTHETGYRNHIGSGFQRDEARDVARVADAAGPDGALDAPEVDRDRVAPGGRAQVIQMARLGLHRLRGVLGKDFFLELGVEARTIRQFDTERVAGNKGFAKDNQMAALAAC